MKSLFLKLKLQYFGHLLQRADLLAKTKDKRKRRQQRMKWVEGITDSRDMSLSKLLKIVDDRKSGMLQSVGLQRPGFDLMIEQQQ